MELTTPSAARRLDRKSTHSATRESEHTRICSPPVAPFPDTVTNPAVVPDRRRTVLSQSRSTSPGSPSCTTTWAGVATSWWSSRTRPEAPTPAPAIPTTRAGPRVCTGSLISRSSRRTRETGIKAQSRSILVAPTAGLACPSVSGLNTCTETGWGWRRNQVDGFCASWLKLVRRLCCRPFCWHDLERVRWQIRS